jgi:hypothetical protein
MKAQTAYKVELKSLQTRVNPKFGLRDKKKVMNYYPCTKQATIIIITNDPKKIYTRFKNMVQSITCLGPGYVI